MKFLTRLKPFLYGHSLWLRRQLLTEQEQEEYVLHKLRLELKFWGINLDHVSDAQLKERSVALGRLMQSAGLTSEDICKVYFKQ